MTPDEILDRIRALWPDLQREYRQHGESPKYHALVRQIRQLTNAYRQAERRQIMSDTAKLKAAVKDVLKAHEHFKALTESDTDCTLCNDAQWWADNGFTEAERRAFCASIGCPIPPEGDVA